MRQEKIKTGRRVVVSKLGGADAMCIGPKHLNARRIGATGTLGQPVAGHGGDVWFVSHDRQEGGQEEVAAYTYEELELLK